MAIMLSILTSLPGVGPITAASLIAWMGKLGSLTHRQVTSLIGVALFAADSGRLHKVALVAVTRKMIVLINALLRDQRDWENRTRLTGV